MFAGNGFPSSCISANGNKGFNGSDSGESLSEARGVSQVIAVFEMQPLRPVRYKSFQQVSRLAG